MCCKRPARAGPGRSRIREPFRPIRPNAGWAAQWSTTPGIWPSGYSTSSTSVFPSIAYAGRLLGDPPGMLAQGEATMFAGTGVQLDTVNRWGDYTAMCLDPADDATFWYTNQYYNTRPDSFSWKTKIGAFKFAGTTAPPQGTLSGTITACDTRRSAQGRPGSGDWWTLDGFLRRKQARWHLLDEPVAWVLLRHHCRPGP